MLRFYLDYVAQWPTVLALSPFVLIGAGFAGRQMALRILAGGKKDDSLLLLGVVVLVASGLVSTRGWW